LSEIPIPTGLQRLLRIAAADAQFRAELLARRSNLAAPASTALTTNERAILDAIPEPQLAAMIAGLPAVPTDRRDFLLQAAAATLLVLAGSGCPKEPVPDDLDAASPGHKPRKAIKCFGHLSEKAKAAGITDGCDPRAAQYAGDE